MKQLGLFDPPIEKQERHRVFFYERVVTYISEVRYDAIHRELVVTDDYVWKSALCLTRKDTADFVRDLRFDSRVKCILID